MLTSDGLLISHKNRPIGGEQRIYRWGNYGLSAIDSSVVSHYLYKWEFSVIKFSEHDICDWDTTYDTPLSSAVEKFFLTDEEANAFIAKAKRYFAG